MNRPRHLHFSFLAAALLAAAPDAPAAPAFLTIGQGWARVRESFPSSGETEISAIHWTHPPPEIDLDTLQVWNVRRPWPLRDWDWSEAPRPAPAPDSAPLVWKPTESLRPVQPAHDQIDIHLASPMSHRMGHSLTYRIPGFDWQAAYRVIVRGIGPTSIQSVQVDLAATLHIVNHTSASYPDARVSLIGTDRARPPPVKPFGLLELNPDSALSDLWLLPPAPGPEMPNLYPLETPAEIPARGQAVIQFAHVVRKPAAIVHVCNSDDIPSPTQREGLPLRRVLHIDNTPAMGLGFPLPPGKADLFLGAVRGAPIQTGYVNHTPYPGTLRIDMGPADTVRASRQTLSETPLPEGSWQGDYSVTLVNNLQSPVQVHVVESPSTPMEWNLVRSSIPCEETTRSLLFDLTLPPESTQTITYQLRLVARNM